MSPRQVGPEADKRVLVTFTGEHRVRAEEVLGIAQVRLQMPRVPVAGEGFCLIHEGEERITGVVRTVVWYAEGESATAYVVVGPPRP